MLIDNILDRRFNRTHKQYHNSPAMRDGTNAKCETCLSAGKQF